MPAPTIENVNNVLDTEDNTPLKADATTKTAENGSDMSEEEAEAKVLKQVEFYFADSNLPFDKFMWTLHSASSEHWIPIATIASFKRMRQFQSKGVPWLANVLREKSTLVEVDPSGTKVRRPDEIKEPESLLERSVYAKGFGEETPTLQDEIEKFFSQWGAVNAIRMRRIDNTKQFKGSVFCEFSSMDSVKSFLEADPKPQWNGAELLTMSKEAYCEMKIKEKGLTGAAAQINRTGSRKGFNAFNLTDKNKQKIAKPVKEENPEIYLEFMGTRLKVNEEDGGSVDESEIPYVQGASLKFTGCDGDVRFAEVKAPLKDRFEKPPYIKYSRGDDFGLVGFDAVLSEEDIAFVREHLKTINGHEVAWETVDDETEKAFQIERAQTAAQRIVSGDTGGSRGGKGGRGGRGGRGGKGGRGNRGGHRGNGGRNGRGNETKDTQTGEKRKRGDESGRAEGVPVIHLSKKSKPDDES